MAEPTICQQRGRHSPYGWMRSEHTDQYECADCGRLVYPVRVIEPPKDWYAALCERVAS